MNTSNCVVYDEPIEVNSAKWAFEHPNCDALILKKRNKPNYIIIKAYALNDIGNKELLEMCDDIKYGIFGGIDRSMLNFIGGII